jgi:3,4-dehydroadipyl-CoA semialdehyde dehydrogenase
MRLESFVGGLWVAGKGDGRPLVNAVNGAVIAVADATGIDISAALQFARDKRAALHEMSFAARGKLLKSIADVLQVNRENYGRIARENSGNTLSDAAVDIDGAIGTLKYYSRLAVSLGEASSIVETGKDQLARDPVFFARHMWTSRQGVAVHVNAFNFPAWGLWEKVAVAILAGVPSVAKPASATALLSYAMVRDVIAAGILPDGALSLIVGQVEGLTKHLGCMDALAFTGSAETASLLRRELAELAEPPRLIIEADSINATILGPDVMPGSVLWNLCLAEARKALMVKAGQLCTNIRRVLVHSTHVAAFTEALAAATTSLVVGDPVDAATQVGPLINSAQRDEANRRIAALCKEARFVACAALGDVAPQSGFVTPTLLLCERPENANLVHDIEVFGPCTTIVPYDTITQATALAALARGSLAVSLFSGDPAVQDSVIADLAAWHGRILLVDESVGAGHTGHAMVMPQCVHGGPGRAGSGEELGGLRGLRLYMQRTAIQGGAALSDRLDSSFVSAQL